MEKFLLDFIILYGPLGIGWIGFAWMTYTSKAQQSRYQEILVHIVEGNTAAMTELTVLLKTKLG